MLLQTVASLSDVLDSALTGKGVVRAGKGTVRAGQDF